MRNERDIWSLKWVQFVRCMYVFTMHKNQNKNQTKQLQQRKKNKEQSKLNKNQATRNDAEQKAAGQYQPS